jgi:hypothetical protein
MLSLASASLSFSAPTVAPRAAAPRMEDSWTAEAAKFTIGAQRVEKPWTSGEISDAAGLKKLAMELNPVVGYFDPLGIGEQEPELIGWFRHAEIKHGRIAMFAFVGYCVQAAGIHFPFTLQMPMGASNSAIQTITYADISAAGGPADQWDALPTPAKLQILFVIGVLELWSESSIALAAVGQKHYVRGGKPGVFPSFKDSGLVPGLPVDLFNPIGTVAKMSPEQKAEKLRAELNNGRLAMIGIIGLLSAAKGCIVPGIDAFPQPQYAGEPMAFFSSVNADLPLVSDMLGATFPWTH